MKLSGEYHFDGPQDLVWQTLMDPVTLAGVLPGAEKLEEDIRAAMELKEWSGWQPPIIRTQARDGQGIDDVFAALIEHRAWLDEHDLLDAKRRRAIESRVRDLVQAQLQRTVWSRASVVEGLKQGLDDIAAGKESPYRLARSLVARAHTELTSSTNAPRGND